MEGIERRFNPQNPWNKPRQAKPQPMNERRAILEYLKSVYAPGVIITESYLRNGVQQGNGATQVINFGFQKSDQTTPTLPTDNKLDMSDTFEVTGFKLSLYTLAATTTGGISTPSVLYSTAQKQYYPNPNVFSGAVGGTEWQNLLAVYNGFLYVKIDSTVFYEQYPADNFLQVGVTEQGTAVSAVAGTGVAKFTSGHNTHTHVPVTPMFMMNGSAKQVIQIQLAESVNLGSLDNATPTRANFVELTLLGFKCQGGAGQKVNKSV